MDIIIKEQAVVNAADEGMDSFIGLFADAILENIGGELNARNMEKLTSDQITLLAYTMLRDEVMDGGFVQLIHNGYGGFIFDNPFARAMKIWGLRDLSKLLYSVRKLYVEHGEDIKKDCSDDEFMALFEKYPEFDNYDDAFVENEEQWTALIAHYLDDNIEKFARVEK